MRRLTLSASRQGQHKQFKGSRGQEIQTSRTTVEQCVSEGWNVMLWALHNCNAEGEAKVGEPQGYNICQNCNSGKPLQVDKMNLQLGTRWARQRGCEHKLLPPGLMAQATLNWAGRTQSQGWKERSSMEYWMGDIHVEKSPLKQVWGSVRSYSPSNSSAKFLSRRAGSPEQSKEYQE